MGSTQDNPCLCCGTLEGVHLEGSRTAYDFRPKAQTRFERVLEEPLPPDPNAPIPLCRSCAEDHHKYWDEMWADYYAGLL